jgi:hypothetical protein
MIFEYLPRWIKKGKMETHTERIKMFHLKKYLKLKIYLKNRDFFAQTDLTKTFPV